MNRYTNTQKGSAVGWTVLIAIIVIGLAAYLIAKNGGGTQPASNEQAAATSSVTIIVPADVAAYKKAMAEHVQVGGPDPLATAQFIATTTTPNTIVADPLQNAAEAAAEYIPTQAGTSSLVTYFKVVNGTAYVVLNMDQNGWAGVSVAIAEVHPIVEKTLLAQPGITTVKFGYAPGDSRLSNSAAVAHTYSNKQFGFEFDYPDTAKVTSDTNGNVSGRPTNVLEITFGDPVSDGYKSEVVVRSGLVSSCGIGQSKTKINGITYNVSKDESLGAINGSYVYSVNHNNVCFEFESHIFEGTKGANQDAIKMLDADVNQILSTFRFTN
ncbi:MAG: hypothetical protein KGI45_00165 [Patescibacteria group bacterium]|nr:hypothetical protein [Patescibacteria group bacterium]MDE1966477.1 hypothetical protein [Patescibacteria group bacterium]